MDLKDPSLVTTRSYWKAIIKAAYSQALLSRKTMAIGAGWTIFGIVAAAYIVLRYVPELGTGSIDYQKIIAALISVLVGFSLHLLYLIVTTPAVTYKDLLQDYSSLHDLGYLPRIAISLKDFHDRVEKLISDGQQIGVGNRTVDPERWRTECNKLFSDTRDFLKKELPTRVDSFNEFALHDTFSKNISQSECEFLCSKMGIYLFRAKEEIIQGKRRNYFDSKRLFKRLLREIFSAKII